MSLHVFLVDQTELFLKTAVSSKAVQAREIQSILSNQDIHLSAHVQFVLLIFFPYKSKGLVSTSSTTLILASLFSALPNRKV